MRFLFAPRVRSVNGKTTDSTNWRTVSMERLVHIFALLLSYQQLGDDCKQVFKINHLLMLTWEIHVEIKNKKLYAWYLKMRFWKTSSKSWKHMIFRVSLVKLHNSRMNPVVGNNKTHPVWLGKGWRFYGKRNMFHHPRQLPSHFNNSERSMWHSVNGNKMNTGPANHLKGKLTPTFQQHYFDMSDDCIYGCFQK